MFVRRGFSLLELLAVLAIAAILSAVAISSYRDYTIRASIAALLPLADKVKNGVTDEHNQGTVFGASGAQTYVDSSSTDKPFALQDITRADYGCVNIGIDLSALKLDVTKQLILTLCPTVDDSSIEWHCGYDVASYAPYVKYLPANCQSVNTGLVDYSF